jgi:hypothetical protein
VLACLIELDILDHRTPVDAHHGTRAQFRALLAYVWVKCARGG